MDYDKVLAYLVAIATATNLITGSLKNISDMRSKKKQQQEEEEKQKRRPPAKKKRRK